MPSTSLQAPVVDPKTSRIAIQMRWRDPEPQGHACDPLIDWAQRETGVVINKKDDHRSDPEAYWTLVLDVNDVDTAWKAIRPMVVQFGAAVPGGKPSNELGVTVVVWAADNQDEYEVLFEAQAEANPAPKPARRTKHSL